MLPSNMPRPHIPDHYDELCYPPDYLDKLKQKRTDALDVLVSAEIAREEAEILFYDAVAKHNQHKIKEKKK